MNLFYDLPISVQYTINKVRFIDVLNEIKNVDMKYNKKFRFKTKINHEYEDLFVRQVSGFKYKEQSCYIDHRGCPIRIIYNKSWYIKERLELKYPHLWQKHTAESIRPIF